MTPQIPHQETYAEELEIRWRLMGHYLEMDLQQLLSMEMLALELRYEGGE